MKLFFSEEHLFTAEAAATIEQSVGAIVETEANGRIATVTVEDAADVDAQWAEALKLHYLGLVPVLPDGVEWVIHTIKDSAGRPLVPADYKAHLVSFQALPTTMLPTLYRGLLAVEAEWRTEDLDATAGPGRGTPVAGAHPVRRVRHAWGLDPTAGPVLRMGVMEYLATNGQVVMSIPWSPKPYGMAISAALNGRATSSDAGYTRRVNVVRDLHKLANRAIATYYGTELALGNTPLAPEVYGGALLTLLEPHVRMYEEGNSPALAAAIQAAAASNEPALAWLGTTVNAERAEPQADGLLAMVSVPGTCASHMVDALIDPSTV